MIYREDIDVEFRFMFGPWLNFITWTMANMYEGRVDYPRHHLDVQEPKIN